LVQYAALNASIISRKSSFTNALYRAKWMTSLDEIFDIDAVAEAAVRIGSSAHVKRFADILRAFFDSPEIGSSSEAC
jgi:hypothetical protein